jgi:hypothetical protein
MRQVPVTEFARNFRQYREIAQREPVAVTRRGRATGYFVSTIDPFTPKGSISAGLESGYSLHHGDSGSARTEIRP